MIAKILTGAKPAAAMLQSLAADIAELDPHLVIIQIGNDDASNSYIHQKVLACKRVGLRCTHLHLAAETTYEEVLATIKQLNTDPAVHGFIIQIPLPAHLKSYLPQLIRAMDPKKDVDGFGAYNLGKMFISKEFEHLPPATPAGTIALLDYYDIPVEGKNIVVIGHSNLVGKPLGTMLLNRNATVTNCHVHTKDLQLYTQHADIICVAAGVPNLLTVDMVSPHAIVLDIGFNRTSNGLTGDTDFEALKNHVQAITPVPGGIGPMTVAQLIKNTVTAAKRQKITV